ncbi:TIGR02594 family protein [Zoogloea sp.]|uniref:TIGR02594 family protein n=1 Tax=Zoogloea sp. TaxID=49181 RepID=UPI0035B24721
MAKWTNAKYDGATKIAQFIDQINTYMLRSGGTLPWRLNNPGNLRPRLNQDGKPDPKAVKTHIGFAQVQGKNGPGGYFLIFPDFETGVEELRANLKRLHNKKSIAKMIEAYAPPKENNTSDYIASVEKFANLSRNQLICDLKGDEFERLVQAIIRKEGYHGQGETPRVEKTAQASFVTLSNGGKPAANVELRIQQDGKPIQVKSDERGLLPPILHTPGGSIALQIQKSAGQWETILSIDPASPGKQHVLTTDQLKAEASTAPHQPSNTASKTPKPETEYIVQPGDNPWKIAQTFKIDVATLQKANNLKSSSVIFPGDKLLIPGSKSETSIPPNNTANTTTPPASTSTDKPQATATPLSEPVQAPTTRSKEGLGSPLATIPADNKIAPWMEIAVREAKKWAGYYESEAEATIARKKGRKVNGVIGTNYHQEVGTGFASLETAWCAAFVNYCLKEAGYEYIKSASALAISRSRLFKKIEQPVYGAIVVYQNPKKPTNGHVGFVFQKTNDKDYAVLGGNQGNTISLNSHMGYIQLLKFNLIGYFIPVSYTNNTKPFNESIPIETLRKNLGVDKSNTETR